LRRESPTPVLAIASDIADPLVAEKVIGSAVAGCGRVDTLVNNDGIFTVH
jgi:hypothetical protein